MPITLATIAPVPSTPVDSTSPDGHLRAVVDPQFGGVMLRIDYSVSDVVLLKPLSTPFTCTVYRQNPDGTIERVRGGDPYRIFGGQGWLYDLEAPLASLVTYWVVPTYFDGTLGPANPGVTVHTDSPANGMWLITPSNPEASISALTIDGRTGTYTGRADLQAIIGSANPAVVLDSQSSLTTTMSLLTTTKAQFNAMKLFAKQGVALRKSVTWERPDAWFVIGNVSFAPMSATVNSGPAEAPGVFQWTIALTEFERPDTAGQYAVFPGHSIADRLASFPTLASFPVRQISGNLLLEDDSMFENVVAWSAGSNTTVSQDLTQAREGTASMLLTSTAAGNVSALGPRNYSVIPGTTYDFTGWVLSQQGGRTCGFEVDFKDEANNYLGFIASTPLQLAQLTWTYVKFTLTIPSTVAYVTLIAQGHATAAADKFNFDVVAFEPLP